ncbi:MAG: DUF4340 domain-containing protein, partial [Chitinispirillales bacterium]|nr:DUF4340 domain-containing protein [Chitinispirillales bacterium]
PANQHTFEVGDEAESTVEIYARNENVSTGVLIIGKNGPDWNSNYVRLMGTNGVYLIPGGLRQALFFDIERWKKKMPEPEPEPDFVEIVEELEEKNDNVN